MSIAGWSHLPERCVEKDGEKVELTHVMFCKPSSPVFGVDVLSVCLLYQERCDG